MPESIKTVLMRRDNLSSEEADQLISEAKEELNALVASGDWLDAFDICQYHFGLEPDYLDELMSDL